MFIDMSVDMLIVHCLQMLSYVPFLGCVDVEVTILCQCLLQRIYTGCDPALTFLMRCVQSYYTFGASFFCP